MHIDNLLTASGVRDKMVLQIGKALYDIDPLRKVLKSNQMLPAVGESYVVVSTGRTDPNGRMFDRNVVRSVDNTQITTTSALDKTRTISITASGGDAESFLETFLDNYHCNSEWYYKFIGVEDDISFETVSGLRDRSVPSENGDWEDRWELTVDVRYFSKTVVVESLIGSISYENTVVRK